MLLMLLPLLTLTLRCLAKEILGLRFLWPVLLIDTVELTPSQETCMEAIERGTDKDGRGAKGR